MRLTDYHASYYAHELTRRIAGGDEVERLSGTLLGARVDLNPHQIDAALFAFRSPIASGALLADEVGLGKTIEAGLVIAQKWAERKQHVLVITPANLRKQWFQELEEKFFLRCRILDTATWNAAKRVGTARPFALEPTPRVTICSYEFARGKARELAAERWDLVVLDEAHRLRNVHRPDAKTALALKHALAGVPKLLLTATPLQNSLLELFGLVSFIDDYTFGDLPSFRERFMGPRQAANRADLRERLKPVCHRTLRKQVLPYIKYTRRLAITQSFVPGDDEEQLYQWVSSYLQRTDLVALPRSQRALLTLVLRKLLASSSFAIAGALDTMTRRLEEQLHSDPGGTDHLIREFGEEYEALPDTLDERGEPDATTGEQPIARDRLEDEIAELRAFRDLALSIQDNAKGRALLTALDRAFIEAAATGSPRKAVIFTESRRTQDYLVQLLNNTAFAGKIVLFNGSNTDNTSKRVYAEWAHRHAGTDRVTGSRAADMRSALVDYFRDEGEIMIATEAGAEGINLQFCSLVVNYDLPWNPQRIEQRIGRCHRYGQKHDVVVVNFLNENNAADKRVLELLSEKFSLFEGVFGASDEVLGAIESGVDFEKRIVNIYQEARTPDAIQREFDQLQEELSEIIRAERDRARVELIEHFDEEVREKLIQVESETSSSLDRVQNMLLDLAEWELGDNMRRRSDGSFDLLSNPFPRSVPLGRYALPRDETDAHAFRPAHPLAIEILERAKTRPLAPATVRFRYRDHGGRISPLETLASPMGWLTVSLLSIEGAAQAEDHLLIAAASDSGEQLDEATAARLFSIAADVDGPAPGAPPAILAEILGERRATITAASEEQMIAYLNEEQDKLDRWSDDHRLSLRRKLDDIAAEMKQAKKREREARSIPDRLPHTRRYNQLRAQRDQLEQENRARAAEFAEKADELYDLARKRLEQDSTLRSLFTIRWRLD